MTISCVPRPGTSYQLLSTSKLKAIYTKRYRPDGVAFRPIALSVLSDSERAVTIAGCGAPHSRASQGASYVSTSGLTLDGQLSELHTGRERLTRGNAMNKVPDQVQGRVEEAKGAVKQTAGRVAGKPDLEDRGTIGEGRRQVQKTFGDVK